MDVFASVKALSRPSLFCRRWQGFITRPRLSVVIVNYVHWEDTARLVAQLQRSVALREGDAEIVIVDNHSPSHQLIARLRRSVGVSLRRWKSNRGFARAVNEGCRLSQGDWILLLNPDVSVASGFLDDVLDRLERLPPQTGIVGFQLRNDDGSHQPSAGRFPNLASTLTRLVLPRAIRKYNTRTSTDVCEVDWVTGCGLLARRDCLEEVGGLDDSFFLYYEDVDFCRRARLAGWSVMFDPTLSIVHHRPLHARAVPPHLRAITRHALLTYADKHWSRWQVQLLGSITWLESFLLQTRSRWQNNVEAQETFRELTALIQDVTQGRIRLARQRLRRIVHRQELHHATATVDCHSQPQSPRPATNVPAKRTAIRALWHASTRSR